MIRRGHSQCGSQWGQEKTFRESDGNVASISPTHLGPGEPAGVQSLTTVLWGAPSGCRDHGGMRVRERGRKSGHEMELAPLRGVGGKRGVPMFRGAHSWSRD